MVWHSAHYAHSVRRRNGCIQCILTKQRKMTTKWNFVYSSHVVNLKIVPKCHQSSTYKIEREKQFPCLIPYSRHIVGKLKSVVEKGIFFNTPYPRTFKILKASGRLLFISKRWMGAFDQENEWLYLCTWKCGSKYKFISASWFSKFVELQIPLLWVNFDLSWTLIPSVIYKM